MKKNEIVAVLWNIRSIHNVASIFRTADGAGVKKIYLCGITPGPTDRFGKTMPRFSKVALGAEKSVEWQAVRMQKEISRLIENLKKDGYKIFAVEQAKKSVQYYRASPGGKIALIVGNEVRGLPPSILKKSDKILEIPMRGAMVRQTHHPKNVGRGSTGSPQRGKESLNVSVTFGIVVYSLVFP